MTQPFWTPEYDVGEQEALEFISTQFPDLRAASIDHFGSGMDNLAYLVDTKYIFRFPRRAIVVPLLETEIRILPMIATHVPIAIPVPRFVGKPQGTYPWTFAGYERIEGTQACSVTLNETARSALAPLPDRFCVPCMQSIRRPHERQACPEIPSGA